MKCYFCDTEAIVHVDLVVGKTLDLCEYHWNKLKIFLEPSLPLPIYPIPQPTYPFIPYYPIIIW